MKFDEGRKLFGRVVLFVASGTLAAMMFLSASDVILRYVFNRPIPGGMELIELMMVVLVSLAMAVTAYDKAHIKVTLIVERFSVRGQMIVGGITSVISLGFFSLLAWQSFDYIFEQYRSGITSAVLLIPHYPFVASLSIAFALLTIISLMHLIQNIIKANKEWSR